MVCYGMSRPVSPADKIGLFNRSLIMRACMDDGTLLTPDRPCNIRREGGQSLVIGGSSLVILEGREGNHL